MKSQELKDRRISFLSIFSTLYSKRDNSVDDAKAWSKNTVDWLFEQYPYEDTGTIAEFENIEQTMDAEVARTENEYHEERYEPSVKEKLSNANWGEGKKERRPFKGKDGKMFYPTVCSNCKSDAWSPNEGQATNACKNCRAK